MSSHAPVVLLVEDNAADTYLVREALKAHLEEFELHVVNDGEKTFRFIETTESVNGADIRPDLLLLDLNVPKKSGKEILQRVRQSQTLGNIPVVILSASDSRSDRAETHDLGATAYFRKPSHLEQFMAIGRVVRNILAGNLAAAE